MRILHTSDWHIGRTFHGHPTLPALGTVLDALIDQVRENAVDVVVVSGDVFDSSTPSAPAYSLLSETLRRIADAGAAVVVSSGNHDSAARLGFQAGLLRDGIHVATDPLALDVPLTVRDDDGEVDIYAIPYLEPAIVRSLWEGVDLRTQAQTMAHAMSLVRASIQRRSARSIVLAHCFAAGVEATPGVEREVRAGTLDVVPLSVFDGPDYVALGHIHGRAQLSERVRYSGAPLHYSFGERDKPRGSWLIELDAEGLGAVEWLPLPVPRPLSVLRDDLDGLLHDPAYAAVEGHWVSVEYTDPTPQRDIMRQLQTRFHHCASVVHLPSGVPERQQHSYRERLQKAVTDEERVDAFLQHVRAGDGSSQAEQQLLREVIDDLVKAEASA